MEEFKNLKEIIDLCQEELDNGINVNATLDLEDLKELQNLINKYKELQKERDGIYADYQDLGKEKLELEEKREEQEKMIELMAKDIEKITCSCPFELYDYEVKDCDNICQMLADNWKQYTCFIEYYEKKAKGE